MTSEAVESQLLPSSAELAPPISALGYVRRLESDLEELLSFNEFVRKNAWKWIGEGTPKKKDYEVEAMRDGEAEWGNSRNAWR
jgi:hypothetical protein